MITKFILFLLLTASCMMPAKIMAQVNGIISIDTTTGCYPLTIHIADSSTGNPDTWLWNFGNGQTSTLPVNDVVYTLPGTYTIKLKVSNSTSVDSAYKTINVLGASANFRYTYTDICNAPAKVSFILNKANSKANYHWDFGDGNKSVAINPSNTFSAPGTYSVHLKTFTLEGCTDSTTQIIEVGGVKADFTAPATACVGEYLTLENTSSAAPLKAEWRVNGTVVKNDTGNLSYHFTAAGVYNIQLIEDFGGCRDTAAKQLQVFDVPVAAFSATGKLQSCEYPTAIQFNNESTNATAYKWYFGDGDSSTEVNPLHNYVTAGSFTPILVAYNANGCSDTLIKEGMIFLGPPIIDKIKDVPTGGCIPLTIKPHLDILSPEAIGTYTWDFGDGTTATDSTPVKTYKTEGTYRVSLTVTTVSGCTTTLNTNPLLLGSPSVPDFTTDKKNVCGNEEIQFTGTASGPVTSWLWDLEDTVVRRKDAVYQYKTTGYKSISLTTNNNGCFSTIEKQELILVSPPVAAFNVLFDCKDRLRVTFRDTSIDAQKWRWDFGDGTFSSDQNPPSHLYDTSGIYTVKLTTENGTCNSSDSTTIAILNGTPVFTYNPVNGIVCRNENIDIAVTNPDYIRDYFWDFGDGVTLFTDTSVTYSYKNAGTYFPSLVAKYTTGCIDTLYSPNPIKVSGPTANFEAVSPQFCANDTITFTDNSLTDGVHEIISRTWDFGDEQTEMINTPPYKHLYSTAGTYKARLMIVDNSNCADTATYPVVINGLPSVSAGIDTFICKGGSLQLQPGGADTYTWNNNNTLSCLSCTSPVADPKISTTYYVTGTDSNNCKATDSVFVKVVQPFTMNVTDRLLDVCLTKSVGLNASGAELYTWQPAAGLDNAAISNPLASPAVTTTYVVTGTDSNHCFSQVDSVRVNVHPNPQVTINNPLLNVEKGSQNPISTTGSNNIIKWYWYPSLGLNCTDCPQPIITAQQTQTYSAVVYADFGCTDTATVLVHVLCNSSKIYITTAFTPNNDGKNDRFYVQSSIDNPVRSFIVYDRTGKRIFVKQNGKTNNPADGWDGTYNGIQVPPGVYIYQIEVLCDGKPVPFKGTITVVK